MRGLQSFKHFVLLILTCVALLSDVLSSNLSQLESMHLLSGLTSSSNSKPLPWLNAQELDDHDGIYDKKENHHYSDAGTSRFKSIQHAVMKTIASGKKEASSSSSSSTSSSSHHVRQQDLHIAEPPSSDDDDNIAGLKPEQGYGQPILPSVNEGEENREEGNADTDYSAPAHLDSVSNNINAKDTTPGPMMPSLSSSSVIDQQIPPSNSPPPHPLSVRTRDDEDDDFLNSPVVVDSANKVNPEPEASNVGSPATMPIESPPGLEVVPADNFKAIVDNSIQLFGNPVFDCSAYATMQICISELNLPDEVVNQFVEGSLAPIFLEERETRLQNEVNQHLPNSPPTTSSFSVSREDHLEEQGLEHLPLMPDLSSMNLEVPTNKHVEDASSSINQGITAAVVAAAVAESNDSSSNLAQQESSNGGVIGIKEKEVDGEMKHDVEWGILSQDLNVHYYHVTYTDDSLIGIKIDTNGKLAYMVARTLQGVTIMKQNNKGKWKRDLKLQAEILKQLKKAKKTAYQALLRHLKENKLTEVHDGKYLYFEAYGELERLSYAQVVEYIENGYDAYRDPDHSDLYITYLDLFNQSAASYDFPSADMKQMSNYEDRKLPTQEGDGNRMN